MRYLESNTPDPRTPGGRFSETQQAILAALLGATLCTAMQFTLFASSALPNVPDIGGFFAVWLALRVAEIKLRPPPWLRLCQAWVGCFMLLELGRLSVSDPKFWIAFGGLLAVKMLLRSDWLDARLGHWFDGLAASNAAKLIVALPIAALTVGASFTGYVAAWLAASQWAALPVEGRGELVCLLVMLMMPTLAHWVVIAPPRPIDDPSLKT